MKVVALMFLTNCFCLITGFIIGKFIYKGKNKKVIDTPFGKNIKFTTEEQFTDVSEIDFGKKSLRPQNTWKPSDEQIEMLENVRKILHTNKDIYSKANHFMYNFEELIRTLKKLKEE